MTVSQSLTADIDQLFGGLEILGKNYYIGDSNKKILKNQKC